MKVTLTGPGALKFLHDVLTQDIASLKPGESSLAALLNEKGRLRAIVRVTATEDGATLDADDASEPGLEAGVVRLAPLAGVEASTERLPAEAPDEVSDDAGRIAAGLPRFGVDVGEDTLIDSAVSFTKGCYPGQESVARVHNLGSVKRRLRVLRIEGPPPGRGAEVLADEVVGVVTSAAADGLVSVAFAMLKAEIGPGAEVAVGGSRGVVLS